MIMRISSEWDTEQSNAVLSFTIWSIVLSQGKVQEH